MICLNCGREIMDNSKFCEFCGNKVEKKNLRKFICNSCGKEINENSNFCEFCGKKAILFDCRIVDDYGLRYRRLCKDCRAKVNKTN